MSSLLQDLKYALRGIARRPGHTALIVLTLALGLGVNTVAFSSVNALIFRPFRIANAADYGWLFVGRPGNPYETVSREMFDTLRVQASTVDTLVAEGRTPLAVASPDGADQAWGLAVSDHYFSVVLVPTVVGRTLSPTDTVDTAIPILISERYWRTRWNAASDLTTIAPIINGQLTSVIGVVADTYAGPGGIFEPHLWFPLSAAGILRLSTGPADAWLTLMARPSAGATPRQIAAQAQTIAAGLDAAHATEGQANQPRRASFVRIIDGHPEARSLRPAAALAMAAVGLVLLIACFNVAGLILARSAERQRELGLRTALGASRLRLTRQLLVEGLLVASIAGAGALLLAAWSEQLLGGLSLPAPIPQRLHFAMDWRMVAFTCLMVVVAATVPVLTPAWRVFRTDPIGWLKSGTAGAGAARARGGRAWMSLQVAGSTVFLTLALMFVASYAKTLGASTGFNVSQVALLQVTAPDASTPPERQRDHITAVVATLAASPAIAQVALAERVPFQIGMGQTQQLSLDGQECAGGGCVTAAASRVTSTFFDAMQIPLVAGRLFDDHAAADDEAVVVSVATAEALWPTTSPLGQWLHADAQPPRQVIGVVADVTNFRMDQPHQPAIYRSLPGQDWSTSLTVVARGRTDATAAAAALRSAWRDLDTGLPAANVQTMEERMALPLWPSRVGAAFFATCGTIAVILVTVGLFGVTYYAVAQRTREFGIRLALGATGDDLRRLVMKESVRLMIPGLVVGLAAAATLATLAQAILVGVSSLDPRWYLGALALQTCVALLASWSPARRAARVSPQLTLRGD